MSKRWLKGWCGILTIALAGCAPRALPPEMPEMGGEPLGLQLVRSEAQLKNYPFFTLLSFERESDSVFVGAEGAAAVVDGGRGHTGTQSLRLAPGTRSLSVKLASLHSGRDWPGDWTLVGAYVYATSTQRLTISCLENAASPRASYTVQVPAGQWTPVLLDISALQVGKAEEIGTLRLSFEGGLNKPLWIDDVVELNNSTVLIDAQASASPTDRWLVNERGFRLTAQRTGLFHEVMETPEASPAGWRVEQVNELRTIFRCPATRATRVIYASGREYRNGKCRPLGLSSSMASILAGQEAAPAVITLAAETGRVDRNTPGDANNDGFNEVTGAYQVITANGRLELQVCPRSPGMVSPVLEIAGLPKGKVLADMEGRLLDRIVYLEDGHVLIELPGTITRPTTVSVKGRQ